MVSQGDHTLIPQWESELNNFSSYWASYWKPFSLDKLKIDHTCILLYDIHIQGVFDDSDHSATQTLIMTVFKFQNLKILNLNSLKTETQDDIKQVIC